MKELYRSNLKISKDIIFPFLMGTLLIICGIGYMVIVLNDYYIERNIYSLFAILPIMFLFSIGYIIPRQGIQDNIVINEKEITIIRAKFIKYWQNKEITIPLSSITSFYKDENSIFFIGGDAILGVFSINKKPHHYNDLDNIRKILVQQGKKESKSLAQEKT